MLNKETTDQIKKQIKEINKEKELDSRILSMITLKDSIRNLFNEYVDDLFAEVNLSPKKSILNENDYLQ